MRQIIFVVVIVGILGYVVYFYNEHAVKGIPLNRPIEEQARAVNLSTWEVEAATVVASKYSVPLKTAMGIAAELRVLRSNRLTIEGSYVSDLCSRRGLTEAITGAFIVDYKMYLASLKNI